MGFSGVCVCTSACVLTCMCAGLVHHGTAGQHVHICQCHEVEPLFQQGQVIFSFPWSFLASYIFLVFHVEAMKMCNTKNAITFQEAFTGVQVAVR